MVGEELRWHGEGLRREVKDGEAEGVDTTVEEWDFLGPGSRLLSSLLERSRTGAVSSCCLEEGTQWLEGEAWFTRKGEAHRGLSLRWTEEREQCSEMERGTKCQSD
jgi:hypothetical protein